MIQPDEALVIASRGGDRSAFEQLVGRTARLLYARLYLLTGEQHRAEDLVQETYLLAWRRIGQLNDPRRFRAWLMSIGQSVVVDSTRRRARLKRDGGIEADPDVLGDVAGDSIEPADAMEDREDRERALGVLAEMPDEYRQVLMLRYLAGADYQTISKQLALSNGSLRGLLHRGMEMLRARMDVKRENVKT